LGGLRRVASGGGVESMLRFRLESGGDGTKHCQKMKRMQRVRFGSMGMKCDTAQWCDDISRRRVGTVEGKGRRQR
jgi:hypothetical protein